MDSALEDARLWGLDLETEDLESGGETGIWVDNVAAFDAFLAVSTQWSMTAGLDGRLIALGLDYTGVKAGLKLAGIKVDPDLWAAIRIIETGARDAMNGNAG